MRAATYTELGPAADVLHVGEMDTPEPGPGEIRVKLHTSGVNPSDWKARMRGRGGAIPFAKITPHSDGAGVVDAVGDGIDSSRVGQRVWVMNGQWKRPFGTAAEYFVQAEKYVVPLPDGIEFAEAACFGIPFLTAQRAVTFDGDVTGQTLLIAGGAGAVGHHAIQVAKYKGARVLTTVSSPEKADYVIAAGADTAINYRTENVAARVEELTGGRGADRIIELNLSANAPLYGRILAPGGTVIIYGTDAPIANIPAQDFIVRGAALKWFIVYELSDAARAAGIADLNQMIADGALTTTIAASFPLDEIAAAHDMVEAAQHIGNVVLDIA
ncbi:MAG: NADPH:quinone reductase [Alphaproteobacteria bacterium]|nr:NADPH:quinone reductase [Alphaproteobacteria bacterium]